MFSVEYFHENYQKLLAAQSLPLIYTRQSYGEVGDSGLHLHVDHYALYVVHGGRGVHEINGHPYGISRGDVYLAPPGSVHAYRDGENLEVDAFCFQIDLFRDDEIAALRSLPGFRGLFLDSVNWSEHRLHLAPERRQDIEALVHDLLAELDKSEAAPDAQVLSRVLFFRLLVVLARLWKEQWREQKPGEKVVVYRNVELAEVLRFCEANFADDISVPQLAAKMFLSPGRFSDIFKKEMGVPPGEYLRRLRLDRAQTLLKTTDRNATDIAHDCGFSDTARFSRAFKSAYGQTPSSYRTSFKNR